MQVIDDARMKFIFLGVSEEGILRVPGSAARIRVRRHFVHIDITFKLV